MRAPIPSPVAARLKTPHTFTSVFSYVAAKTYSGKLKEIDQVNPISYVPFNGRYVFMLNTAACFVDDFTLLDHRLATRRAHCADVDILCMP
ncbi:hypothetical protein F2P81_006949 [Scophthalmus maximus]|uniref:Uncharacterized protein n=1 Tax=Scophthalmus maximus TaxID=52904 RepID=A0A6A4TDY2_SCOMX|nr:hypothetical protein F2P81_006949 [Scophthalmus maximus]